MEISSCSEGHKEISHSSDIYWDIFQDAFIPQVFFSLAERKPWWSRECENVQPELSRRNIRLWLLPKGLFAVCPVGVSTSRSSECSFFGPNPELKHVSISQHDLAYALCWPFWSEVCIPDCNFSHICSVWVFVGLRRLSRTFWVAMQ
jgi:hypothetical protein